MALTSYLKSKSNASKPRGISGTTFASLGNLIKLLPTGTVFMFQFLNPVLTNNGQCHTFNKYLSGLLVGACAFSCAFSCFTDSFTGADGMIHYGIATAKGLWPSSTEYSRTVDLSKYKLRVGDFVHALLSTTVFAAVTLLDPNTVECFYPSFKSEQKVLLQALPPVIGAISSAVFMVFPSNRHGIGYPFSSDESDDQSASEEAE
ncbi:protein DMP2 [Eucalyptus grandis]|uniref:Uncharacterized protein n=2 Tax=Eucalyptus grandis TaxID=71139 RepID=A0ACC3JUH6_EUCGR|nr:protein DMP2 [Eucalyptus grandis]KAK3417697.1 hypothetical protein EUGRSUZ_H03644 [Eucalyptus grandis]